MNPVKPLHIVLAEDDDGHAELIFQGLKSTGIKFEFLRFTNGQEALDYFISDKVDTTSRSYVLILDVNMPILNGIELLKRLKKEPKRSSLPIIMLTTADDPKEVEQCYALGCNAYITKPIDFSAFSITLQRLGHFLQIIKI